ncbi:MAG: GNAT family N-acetyltransferase [Saccharofermentans sp.]|nr:GNAT family N-acetyltransferase [Saccharofermentans sp.]
MEVIRATEEWQRAGAYSVRIQGMNRQHKISLREEFDEHDADGNFHIVLLDDGYPVATCRFYEIGQSTVSLGRVVVIPEYRKRGLGARVISEAESWAKELGYLVVEIDSRIEVKEFYLKMGYIQTGSEVIMSGIFDCIKMKKNL